MNVVAIIQARLGSERLPGKALADILGQPVLWHITQRLRAATLVDRVVIACPDNAENEPIVRMAQGSGIDCYTGSENNLLDRIYRAARQYEADAVVLITGDLPLIDAGVVDRVIRLLRDNRDKYDVAATGRPLEPRPLPDGLDTMVIAMDLLARLWQETTDPFLQEWFAANISKTQPRFATLPGEGDMRAYRWLLDYPADLDFIRQVYRELYPADHAFGMDQILALLQRRPELRELNRGHVAEEHYRRVLKAREGE